MYVYIEYLFSRGPHPLFYVPPRRRKLDIYPTPYCLSTHMVYILPLSLPMYKLYIYSTFSPTVRSRSSARLFYAAISASNKRTIYIYIYIYTYIYIRRTARRTARKACPSRRKVQKRTKNRRHLSRSQN